ncbi:MAG: MOSC domain-containing protein [Arcobacter butzleri]|jgi:MOSC domain-containing protein YiiM|nr:MOSC domain-containing protein [Arcobacteraceae bacterium]MDY0364293.1 MOSC domain-containing protein [Arcobacteraceae bacterium]NLO17410.1 MOSC domain-containing protein [Aliarcobacter butzleri]
MSKIEAKVLYIKVSTVEKLQKLSSNQEFDSAIKKLPIENAFVNISGLDGDYQADTIHHGGLNKALFFMSSKSYDRLNTLSNNNFSYDQAAFYGENIVLDTLNEEDICIGDIFTLGDAIVEISQPRQPCWKLSANTKTKSMTNIIYTSGLTGWYARVLQEGKISKNDNLILQSRSYPSLTITNLNKIIIDPSLDIKLTQEALSCPKLGHQFKTSLDGRSKLENAKNVPFLYHKEL